MSKERYGDPTTPLEDIFTLPLAYQDIEGRFGVKNQGLPSGVSGEGLRSKIPGYVEFAGARFFISRPDSDARLHLEWSPRPAGHHRSMVYR